MINTTADAVINIYAMTGALVANGVSNQTIDISMLEAGIYQVVINENGNKMTHKLVIE